MFAVDGKTPLMLIKPSPARRWVASGEATLPWQRGERGVRLKATNRVSLQEVAPGKQLCQNANLGYCKFLTFNGWRARLLTAPCNGV
jgi:hypothetical protein